MILKDFNPYTFFDHKYESSAKPANLAKVDKSLAFLAPLAPDKIIFVDFKNKKVLRNG